MGLFDDEDLLEIESLIEEANRFRPQELCETNVQTIFNRCLERTSTKKTTIGLLFPTTTGYAFEVDLGVIFDKELILKNKRNIEYLFGQLQPVHSHDGTNSPYDVTLGECRMSYMGRVWAENERCLLQLFYLGSASLITSIFYSKEGFRHFENVEDYMENRREVTYEDYTSFGKDLKPTLSPKDPAFPAWWEQHKSEWED